MLIFGKIPFMKPQNEFEQAVKTKPKQDKSFSFSFSSFLTVYLLFKCRFVAW